MLYIFYHNWKKCFKRHPWKIDKVLKYFETTLLLWHCCESQAWNVFMSELYKFSQILDSLFIYSFKELMHGWNEKLNFAEMNLFKKENLSSNCRRHNKTWSNGHLFMDCHQPSPKATCLLPTYHFLPVPPTADDLALPLPQASHMISRLCFPFSKMKTLGQYDL